MGVIETYLWNKGLGEIWKKILNFFGIKTQAQKMQEKLDTVEEKTEKLLQENDELKKKTNELKEKKEQISQYERIMKSLERKGISREKLIQDFNKRIPIILLHYTNQEIDSKNNKFIKRVLEEKYDAKELGRGIKAIPPEKVPSNIKNNKDLERWVENEFYQGKNNRTACIPFVALADIRKKIYWRNDYDYTPRYGKPIGEAINIENFFKKKGDFFDMLGNESVAVKEIIEKGDIAFFASKWLSEEGLKEIHKNQNDIENKIGNPNLRELVNIEKEKLIAVLKEHIEDASEVAEGIIEEAKIWKSEIYSKDLKS